jgi:thioesterase domain-containing protein/acyl carrier protein
MNRTEKHDSLETNSTSEELSPVPASGTHPQLSYAPPGDEIEMELVKIWRDLLEHESIGIRDNFFELGGDSILAAHLMFAIESKYHRRIELSRLISHPTIEALAQELRSSNQTNAVHIVPLHPEGNRPPLFCVHCATGHVLRYRDLTSFLDADLPVYGLRAPDVRESSKLPTVEELAQLYVSDIRQIQPHGPYQICGFSFGGLVAFEAARLLITQGEPVSVLALLDAGNPAHYRSLPLLKSLRFRSVYLSDRISKYARRLLLGEWRDFFGGLRDLVVWRAKELLWRYRSKRSDLPKNAAPEDLRDTVVMFAAIGWPFTPKSYPGRIHLFRAEGRSPEFGDDLTLGWEGIAQNGVEVYKIPGEHLLLLEKPYVAALAAALAACLSKNTSPM